MTISEHDLWIMLSATALLVALITWTLCWVVAIRYGQRTGRYLERRTVSRRPTVAMVRLPAGVASAHAVLIDPDPGAAEELASSWSQHHVVNG